MSDTDNVTVNELINEMLDKKHRARWEISCDGWYPYCTNCCYEPWNEIHNQKKELSDLTRCPVCGSVMTNCKEFIKRKDEEK